MQLCKKTGHQISDAAETTTANLEECYIIGKSQNFSVNIPALLQENQDDPAMKV